MYEYMLTLVSNFSGLSRIRELLYNKLSEFSEEYKRKGSSLEDHIVEIISNRVILTETENDKLINNAFNIESHLHNFISRLLAILLNRDMNDSLFEKEIKKACQCFIGCL